MIVQISLSGNLFVFGKKSVSPAFAEKCFYHLLLVSFIVQKKFSWKNLIRNKMFSWRKNKTSFISSWFLLHLDFEQKLFPIFQLSFYFFAFVVLSLSSFSILFFCCLSSFSEFSKQKSFSKKTLSVNL